MIEACTATPNSSPQLDVKTHQGAAMKASIVIPARNEAAFLGRTLAAASSQHYTELYEIIVVDNGSTDGTGGIARAVQGVRVVREDRVGLLYARECGRQAARGEIIVQLDADNIPDSGWLARGISFFKNPCVVCVSGPYFYYDAGAVFRTTSYSFQLSIMIAVHSLLKALQKGGIIIGGNTFIRAGALERIGGYDTTIEFYGEDADTARRLSGQGEMVFSPSLYMNTSARRFQRVGYSAVIWLYWMNFFRVHVHKRPFTR